MAYNPIARSSQASSSYMNARIQEGIVRVADAAALTATLAHPLPPADGAWIFQTDIETIKQKAASSFSDVLNVRRARTLAAPDIDFLSSTATDLGTLTMSAQSGVTTLAALDASSRRFFEARRAADGTLEVRGQTAQGLKLQSMTTSNQVVVSDSGVSATTGATITLQAATLDLRSATTGGPLLSLGGAAAGAVKVLGTDSSGAVIAFDRSEVGGAGGGGGLSGIARDDFVVSPVTSGTVTVTSGTVNAFVKVDQKAFTAPGTVLTGATTGTSGIVIGTTGFYSLALNIAIEISTASQGDWGVELVHRRGTTDINVWDFSAHTSSASNEDFMETIATSMFRAQAGDEIFYRVIFQAAAAGTLNFAVSPSPRTSELIVRKYNFDAQPAATAFLALTDTPAAWGTAGQSLRMNTGLDGLEFYTPTDPTIADDSIAAIKARASTPAYRQEWWTRLQIPLHETITHTSFVLLAGVPSSGGLAGFLTSPLAGTLDGRTTALTINVDGARYQISGLWQVTLAGGTLNDIVIRFEGDPSTSINGEWQLQIGSLVLDFSAATQASLPGGRTSYTWTGNAANIIEGGQSYNCALRVPIIDQLITGPINFSQIQGTVGATQYGDDTIGPSKIIGGSLSEQAQLRGKMGFAALSDNALSVLKYRSGQIVQEPLDITSLNNFGPNAEPAAGVSPLLMKWGPGGLVTIPRLSLSDLPQPVGLAAGHVMKWDGTAWTTGPDTGGTGSAFSWPTAGRMPNLNSLPAFTSGNRKVIFGTTTDSSYEFRQPQFSDLLNQIAASQIGADTINGSMVGADTLTARNINVTDLSSWQSKLGIPASSQASVATWARAGNTDLIPDSKLDPFAYHSYSVLETMTLTVGHYSGARGFDRITGGGGSLSDATFNLSGGNVTVIAIDQLPSSSVGGMSQLGISLVGNLPTDFDQYYLVFERTGFAKVLRIGDAIRSTPPPDTNYPSGLQTYTRYAWADQPDNILYRQAANTTTKVYIAAPFDIAIEHFLLLPQNPTTSSYKFFVANNMGASYRDVDINGATEAEFTMSVSSVQRTNQDAQQIVLAGSGNASFFTRSGNVLTARSAGWCHVALAVRPGAGNDGKIKVSARVNNVSVAERTVEHYRDVIAWSLVHDFSVGDTLQFYYEALDVPTSASEASLPAAPTYAVPTYSASDNETTVTLTAPSTSLYDYVEYARRIHGAGTTDWEPWTRILGDSTTIYVQDVNKERTDIRVRLVNSAGAGRFRQWLAGATSTTTEATAEFGQTAVLSGDIHLSRQSIRVN